MTDSFDGLINWLIDWLFDYLLVITSDLRMKLNDKGVKEAAKLH